MTGARSDEAAPVERASESAVDGSMRTFLVVWFGQLVSLVGSNLTAFGLVIFVFLETGSATQMSFILIAAQVPMLLFTPVAGALVDRWDRRWAMIISDAGAGATTLAIAALVVTDNLEVWHLYPLLGLASIFQSFQWPAYSAATSLLVSKENYGRAAGLVQLAEGIGQVIAPAMAGALLVLGGLWAVILVDVVSFVVAVITLLVVRFPAPERSAAGKEGEGTLWEETRFGFAYLRHKPSLLALLGYFAALNFAFGAIGVAFFPLVLGFASETAAGTVVSIAGVGMVLGSVVMGAWGGPRRKVNGVFASSTALGAAFIVIGLRPSLPLIAIAAFVGFATLPIGAGASQAIWQSKVEPDVQGRVFAVRRLISQATAPLALLAVGPAIDLFFAPAMEEGGSLAGSVGSVIGTGDGRGAALMIIVLGALTLLITVTAIAYAPLRNIEAELPDWDAQPAVAA